MENQINLVNLSTEPVSYKGRQFHCAIPTDDATATTPELIQRSCPSVNLTIARLLGEDGVIALYRHLGWYKSPDITDSEPATVQPIDIENMKGAALGQEISSVSPLQMAMAAASISQGGAMIEPMLRLAYQAPDGNWVLLPAATTNSPVFSIRTANTIQRLTELSELPAWGVVGRGLSGTDRMVTWFVGGTSSEWKGSPLAVAFVLEEDNATLAFNRGRELLRTILME
jgi:membrane peptidoglycan carboxypeptidase